MRLKWERCDDTWTAVTDILDPVMNDEPEYEWCPEWCLQWRIEVDDDGLFSIMFTDSHLLKHCGADYQRKWKTFEECAAAVDRMNDYIHEWAKEHGKWDNGDPVILLEGDDDTCE